jgi:hypothetical protein
LSKWVQIKRAHTSLVVWKFLPEIYDKSLRLKSSQYAEAVDDAFDRQSKQIKIISMLRHTSLNTTYCMKIGRYLSVIMSIGAIWCVLDVRSSARGFSLEHSTVSARSIATTQQLPKLLAQTPAPTPIDLESDKDLRLQYINVTRNSSDKSLLTVSGSINNRSEQTHYIYYIVAKFVSKDVSIKQAIIPLNIDIEPGKSKSFSHEISAQSIDSISPETVKPVVVKYEYR